ncbi:MAG: hypothetical protein KDB14_06710, partial [Planctomycetales bacterium]|nr:hypothetical protein [Planctomycetales bacterium]
MSLWKHKATGKWCVQHKGRRFYLHEDKAIAEAMYEAGRRWYEQGVKPPENQLLHRGQATVRDILNAFVRHQQARLEAGEIAHKTRDGATRTCDLIARYLNRERRVMDLGPVDFTAFREQLGKDYSATTTANELVRIKGVFKWAWQMELIPAMPNMGPAWK